MANLELFYRDFNLESTSLQISHCTILRQYFQSFNLFDQVIDIFQDKLACSNFKIASLVGEGCCKLFLTFLLEVQVNGASLVFAETEAR